MTNKLLKSALGLLAASALAGAAAAQVPAQPAAPPVPGPMTVKPLKPGLFMIVGGGGNTTVRVTDDAVILVDGKNNGQAFYDELLARIRSVTDKPVRYLFNTHHHADHTGNNQRFIDAGAQVVASDQLRMIILTYTPANGPRPAAPTVTFARDHTVTSAGRQAHAHHEGPGHTGGDAVIYFPDLKAVALGDQLVAATPNIDSIAGGTAIGWSHNLAEVLKLDFDVAVPGHGDDPMTKDQVRAFKAKLDTFIERGRALIKAGTPKSEFMAKLKVDDLGWDISTPIWNQPARIDNLYAELSR